MSKLKLFRELRGLSQGELAKAIKTNQARISNWEKEPGQKGYRQIPLKTARDAATVLNCLLTELRPDLLSTKSIDLLLEGAPAAIRDDIRDYAIYKLKQSR